MASYYEALPIYRAAIHVAVCIDGVVQRFAKRHKYTLGGRLGEAAVDIILLIARANRRAERARALPLLCDRVEELKLMVNLGKEVKAFASFKQYAEVMDQVGALARQAEAWRGATPSYEGAVTRACQESSRAASPPPPLPLGAAASRRARRLAASSRTPARRQPSAAAHKRETVTPARGRFAVQRVERQLQRRQHERRRRDQHERRPLRALRMG